MEAWLAAAGLVRRSPAGAGAPAGTTREPGGGGPESARVAAARSRASERSRRQRDQMRPLAFAFIAAVVISGEHGRPAPGLAGILLGITVAIAVCAVAAAVGLNPRWGERGIAAQALVIGLVGGGGVALAAVQPHGATGLAASLAVWIAAVRLPVVPAAVASAAVTAALAAVIALTQRLALQPAIAVTLFCVLLAVTGRFIRRSRESRSNRRSGPSTPGRPISTRSYNSGS